MHLNSNNPQRSVVSNNQKIGRSNLHQNFVQNLSDYQNNDQKNIQKHPQNNKNSNLCCPSSYQYNPYYLDPLQKQKKNKQTQFYNILDKCTQLPAQTKLLLRNYIKSQNQEVWHLFQKYKNTNITRHKKDKSSQNITNQMRRQNSKDKLSFSDLQISLRKFINKQKIKMTGDHDQNWTYYDQNLFKRAQDSTDKNCQRLNNMNKSVLKAYNKKQENSKDKNDLKKQKTNSSSIQLRQNSLNKNKIIFAKKSGDENSESIKNTYRRASQKVSQGKLIKTFRHSTSQNQKQDQQQFLKTKMSNRTNKVEIRKISMAIDSASVYPVMQQRRALQINSPIKDINYQLKTNQKNTQTESVCLGSSSHINAASNDSQNSNIVNTINTINSFNLGMTNPNIQFLKVENERDYKNNESGVKNKQQQQRSSKKKLICIKIGTPSSSSKQKDSTNKQKLSIDPFYLQKKIQREIDFQIERERFKCQSNEQAQLFKDISLRQDEQSQQSWMFDGNAVSFNRLPQPQQLGRVQGQWSKIKNKYKYLELNDKGCFEKNKMDNIPNINVTITPSYKQTTQIQGKQPYLQFKKTNHTKSVSHPYTIYKQRIANYTDFRQAQLIKDSGSITHQQSTHRTFIDKTSMNSIEQYHQKHITPIIKHQQDSQAQSSVYTYFPFGFTNKNNQLETQTKTRNYCKCSDVNYSCQCYADCISKHNNVEVQKLQRKFSHCCVKPSDFYADQKIKQLPLGSNFQFHQEKHWDYEDKDSYQQKKKKSITNNRYYRNLDTNRSLKSLGSYRYLISNQQTNQNDSFLAKLQQVQNMSVQDYSKCHRQNHFQSRGQLELKDQVGRQRKKFLNSNILQESKIKIVQNQHAFDEHKLNQQNQVSRRLFSSIFTEVQDFSHKKNIRKQKDCRDKLKQRTLPESNYLSKEIPAFKQVEMLHSIRNSQNIEKNTYNISYYNDLFQNGTMSIIKAPCNFKIDYQCSLTQEYIPSKTNQKIAGYYEQRGNDRRPGVQDIISKSGSYINNSKPKTQKRAIFSQSLERLDDHSTSNFAAVKFAKQYNKGRKYQPGDFYKKIKMAIEH